MSQATIQSIADHLGISKYAVSRALAGKSGVSEETRRTVIRAAHQLGYVARTVGRGVQKGNRSPRRIEVLFRDRAVSNREQWIDARHGIEMEAARNDLTVEVEWTKDVDAIRRLADAALGFVLLGPHDWTIVNAVRETGLAAVALTHALPPLCEMDQINTADEESGRFVAQFLTGLGHRTMVYVHGQLGFRGRELRLLGFRDAADMVKGTSVQEIAFPEDYTGASLGQSLLEMSNRGINPTAFFCGSDGVAVTVISELTRLGIKVPQDVSVVGHADYPVATQISPHLTTIHVPNRQMGIMATRLLQARAGMGEPPSTVPFQRITLVSNLIERQSTGPCKEISWIDILITSQV